MPAGEPLHLAVFAWLLACVIQDWRSREVSNWLTLPPLALAFCLRLVGLIQGSLLPLLAAIAFLLLFWQRGWIGGADAKASLALALLDMQVCAWAWLGLGVWYLGLRLCYGRKCDRRLPAFVGFTAGVGALLVVEVL
ncbi:MAG: prepilin peptidase [Chloroflexota bacterium]